MFVNDWLNGFKQGKSHLAETLIASDTTTAQAPFVPLDVDTEIPQVFYFRRKTPLAEVVGGAPV